jgi:CRP-like cAMP-binding protein
MIVIMSDDLLENICARVGEPRSFDDGQFLFRQDDPVRSLFVIEDGLVELVRYQPDGTSITLQRTIKNTILAEASLYSECYHCDAVVRLPSRISAISKTKFLSLLKYDEELSTVWAAHLAREVQSARSQIDILSRKTVAERLDGWLAWNHTVLPEKGQWKSIADHIGVSPEALYREIAKRRSS